MWLHLSRPIPHCLHFETPIRLRYISKPLRIADSVNVTVPTIMFELATINESHKTTDITPYVAALKVRLPETARILSVPRNILAQKGNSINRMMAAKDLF
jgi:hypothetical protein